MAKVNILILCPSGHRRKAQMSPNGNLLQVLDEMCLQEKLDSSEWGLIHQRKKCDLTVPWRLLSIPANALLEMFKLDKPRAVTNISVQLQLADNSRQTGSFMPTENLKQMLDWFRNQSESALVNFERSIENVEQSTATCAYMSEEIIGNYALTKTTLKDLGLTGGSAVIRFNYRSVNEEELTSINAKIDDKIKRRSQRETSNDEKQTPMEIQPMKVEIPQIPSNTTTVQISDDDQYSIFRAAPPSPPKRSQEKPKTLSEALGLRISFDSQPIFGATTSSIPQPDFTNFKFPEETKGLNLLDKKENEKSSANSEKKNCDRNPMMYDLNKMVGKSSTEVDELPDSFFELTADDLRSVIQSLREQSCEENALETRSMRERIQSARSIRYERLAIRFLINSNFVVQAFFGPEEKMSVLLDFLRENFSSEIFNDKEFYLYTRPPKVILSDMNKSLGSYDLAPASFVYLAHRKISPIKLELPETLSIGTIDEANDLVNRNVFSLTRQQADSTSNKRPNNNTPIADQQLKDKMKKFLPGKK